MTITLFLPKKTSYEHLITTMDARLYEAARRGDTDHLHQLLHENPLILEIVESPLIIACIAGKVEFVKEIIRLKPEIAKEANQDGFSPIHIAAANGHVDIVNELMKVDPSICLLEGRDKMTPLHYAAIKGKAEVIGVLLSSYPECINAATVQLETPLHLAVKTNQLEATKLMVDRIREIKKDEMFNVRDEQGNTVLHLAVWKKQRQVIELLLDSRTCPGSLEVNATNHYGLTALDVLLLFQSEAGDREILEILQAVGARKARDIALSTIPHSQTLRDTCTAPETDQSQQTSVEDYFKFKRGRDSPSTARDTLLVIAILVATATFQVGVNPPGGFWQDTYKTDTKNSSSNIQAHNAGESILGTRNVIGFSLIMFFNTLGFLVSVFMINILTCRFPLQFELQICLAAMSFTYNTALINTAPDKPRLYVILVSTILCSLTPILMKWGRRRIRSLNNV
ncbi:ankyrin repeat-containing protein BDA1 [Mercurialis annua]|uniref:ankyrin repeat-containing protein BDA1 n=1 Tax=Mercurialis annua TaxID=3986 RepID=UPI00215EF54C|nr:ankyrin repeat-containing protein BDA1 [Mercurialis annua]